MAETLEELLVWKKANGLWDAVNPLLDSAVFRKDRNLREQIRDALDSVVANISEGFEQPTDKSFAQYLYRSKASAGEVRARLLLAMKRRYITVDQHDHAAGVCTELIRMLTGFIKYLLQSNRTRRGLGVADTPLEG